VAIPIAMTRPVSIVKLLSVIAVGLIVTFVIYPQRVRFLIRRRRIWRP
jgi:predicted membrane protein